MLAAALAIVITAGPALVAIPDEAGAQVLVEAAIYQAVAADLDGDGRGEIVVLTHGDGSAIAASAWRETAAGWRQVGRPLEVVPGATIPGVAWLGSPVRLVVRAVDGAERVTLLRQPAYREATDGSACCLLVDDLVLGPDGLRLVPAAATRIAVDAVWAVDLDGDGTDELVSTTSVPPLGDTSFPTDARVYRWSGDRFTVTDTRLNVGSGDTPFALGDSDGRPGEELAIIATAGRPALYRVALGVGDTLLTEDAGLVALDAEAVPLDDGRGIALLTSTGTLAVRPWPSGAPLGPVLGEVPMGDASIIGTVALAGIESLIVRQTIGGDRVHALGLPTLAPPRFGAITRSPAAAAFGSGPVAPFVGPLPGGLPDGSAAIISGGRLLGTGPAADAVPFSGLPFATLAGAQPIGLVGADGSQIALLHAPTAVAAPIDPRGGRMDPPSLNSSAAVTVAPFDLARQPEVDDAEFEPPDEGAIPIGARRSVLAGPAGFAVQVDAPAGSRVYVATDDPSVVSATASVPEAGTVRVQITPPSVATPNARFRAILGVTTPAGHGYLAAWEVRVLDRSPPLDVSVVTPIGSGEVDVAGRSTAYSTVTVDGQPVAVDGEGRFAVRWPAPPWPTEIAIVATDPFGNVASATVTGIGWLDYRGLPWIGIVAVGVAIAAAVLYLRVPRVSQPPRRADDDAGLEELEPD
ncbi:MAG TPA: hypothetical protein VF365_09945 [Candidatus Limnocylindria bacterium]